MDRVVISLRVSPDLKARMAEAAKLDERDLNGLIVTVMKSWLDNRLYQPGERPLDDAAKARQAAANAPYKRPRGRPMARADGARQDWIIAIINRDFPRDSEQTLDDIMQRIAPDGGAVNFSVAVERNLVLAGWQQVIRTSDDAVVWLGPDHPARATLIG